MKPAPVDESVSTL